MLKIEEFLDIEKIENIRKISKGKGLDEFDNFSWHIALKDDNNILGAARLYRYKDGVMIDIPCLLKYEENHYQMLLRTLLLKTVTMKIENVYITKEENFLQFNFTDCGENLMKVKAENIIFPRLCGGCKGCE